MKIETQLALLLNELRVKIREIHFPRSPGGRATFKLFGIWWFGIVVTGIVIYFLAIRG